MDSNSIDLKCIDDFNNKLALILKKNINNFLEITNINYSIDIPEINLFGESSSNITSNLIFERTESQNSDSSYNKTMLYNPYN